jgi:hypothetical protein
MTSNEFCSPWSMASCSSLHHFSFLPSEITQSTFLYRFDSVSLWSSCEFTVRPGCHVLPVAMLLVGGGLQLLQGECYTRYVTRDTSHECYIRYAHVIRHDASSRMYSRSNGDKIIGSRGRCGNQWFSLLGAE